MKLSDLNTNIISDFYQNSMLLDTALAIDNFFENTANIYPYKNWYSAGIVAGPSIQKFWVIIILRFEQKCIPDPHAIKILQKLGCVISVKKIKEQVPVKVQSRNDLSSKNVGKMEIKSFWAIKISIPRHLLSIDRLDNLDYIDADLDINALEDAMINGGEDNAINSNGNELNPVHSDSDNEDDNAY